MIKHKYLAATALAVIPFIAGCKNYATERPDVNQVDLRDSGLQSREVVQASDQMAADLLSSPSLNKSPVKWTVVVMNVDNKTENSRFNLDIFLQRLQSKLASQAPDRIQIIENKDKYHDIQNKEVEGQGPGPLGIQPNYGLYAVITELPNQGTSYYHMSFRITNLQDRTIAWEGMYEVRVAR